MPQADADTARTELSKIFVHKGEQKEGRRKKKIERTQTRGARMGVLDEGNIKKWNI